MHYDSAATGNNLQAAAPIADIDLDTLKED